MQVSTGDLTFDWNSQWAKVPDHITLGYTHGVIVDKQGLVHVFNQSRYGVVTFDGNGHFISTWAEFPSDRFLGAHGMTYTVNGSDEYVWLTDQTSCEVVKTTLTGETVISLGKPEHEVYAKDDAKYSPTWAVESPMDGTVFVADGYGSSYISRYSQTGQYLDSFDGSNGAGKFACPHAVQIFTRPDATGLHKPLLYVTDRGNSRIQVFDLDLNFIKSFDQKHPCCFAEKSPGGELLVPDLQAFIAIYDAGDKLVGTLGDQPDIVGNHGWPNVPHDMRHPGKFNSPHGGTYDHEGNIYIVEWIEDGRVTKLTRHS